MWLLAALLAIGGCATKAPVIIVVPEPTVEVFDPCTPPSGEDLPTWSKGKAFNVKPTACI